MHERPADLTDAELVAALREHWRLDIADVRYAPVGYGGYHWTALDASGLRWFVTVSRLGRTGDLADLRATMLAARDLADAGLHFVVAPMRASSGDVVIHAWPDYAISVFPFIDGVPGHWGDTFTGPDRVAMTDMLALLHTTVAPAAGVPVRDLSPPSRPHLEISLRERGRSWRGGPYAEAARELVSQQADGLATALAVFDDLAAQVAASSALVVTHGEPKPNNVIRRGQVFLLIDWDTVGLAPPERDLWWILSDSGAEAARYTELTGCEVSQQAVSLYRLRWDLDDIGLLLADFRAVHKQDKDTEVGWAGLVATVQRLVAATGRRR